MIRLIDTNGTMTAISKLLADKKKKLSEYYTFEQENSLFDLAEEDAKNFIEEKETLKKEVKTLDYYLLDIEEVQMAYQRRMSKERTSSLHEFCLLSALKRKNNEELMEQVRDMKDVLYESMISGGASDYLAKTSVLFYLNAFVRKHYIH